MPAIMVMSIWQAVGFHMIIWLAGLQTIPAELYEAAALDGASGWQRFRNITWPGLRPTRTFILITITIAALSLFTQISVMTQGGPLDSTTTVVFMAVRTGYEQQATGYAAAVSLVFFVLVLVGLRRPAVPDPREGLTWRATTDRLPATWQVARLHRRTALRMLRSSLVFAFPIVFMFVSSFKPDAQIFADLTSLRAFLPGRRHLARQLPRGVRPGAGRRGSC